MPTSAFVRVEKLAIVWGLAQTDCSAQFCKGNAESARYFLTEVFGTHQGHGRSSGHGYPHPNASFPRFLRPGHVADPGHLPEYLAEVKAILWISGVIWYKKSYDLDVEGQQSAAARSEHLAHLLESIYDHPAQLPHNLAEEQILPEAQEIESTRSHVTLNRALL